MSGMSEGKVLTFVNREVNVKLVRIARGCWDVLAVLDDRGECQVLDFIADVEGQLAGRDRWMSPPGALAPAPNSPR